MIETKWFLKPALEYRDFALGLIAQGDDAGFTEYEKAGKLIEATAAIMKGADELVSYFFMARSAIKFVGMRAALAAARPDIKTYDLYLVQRLQVDANCMLVRYEPIGTAVKITPQFAKDFSEQFGAFVRLLKDVGLKYWGWWCA